MWVKRYFHEDNEINFIFKKQRAWTLGESRHLSGDKSWRKGKWKKQVLAVIKIQLFCDKPSPLTIVHSDGSHLVCFEALNLTVY